MIIMMKLTVTYQSQSKIASLDSKTLPELGGLVQVRIAYLIRNTRAIILGESTQRSPRSKSPQKTWK